MLQSCKDWLLYFIFRFFFCAIQAMRIETCQSIARCLAFIAGDALHMRRGVIKDNLRHAFPAWTSADRRRVTGQMWEHLFLMVCEIAHVPRKIHETNWQNFIQMHRRRELVKYLLDPRPVVIVSGHFGNFELASYMAGLLGFSTYAIARPLDNLYLHRFLNRFRESKGQYFLPKEGSANRVQQVLESGGTLALLGDQHAGPNGCWVDFLGRPASCHKALAVFTLTAGAPMLVCYAKRTTGPFQFELGLEDIVDPAQMDDALAGVKPLTQWYNEVLGRLIRRNPEQYWWVHRRWKGSPPIRRRKKRSAVSPATEESQRRVA